MKKWFEIAGVMCAVGAGMGFFSNWMTDKMQKECDASCPPDKQQINEVYNAPPLFKLALCTCEKGAAVGPPGKAHGMELGQDGEH